MWHSSYWKAVTLLGFLYICLRSYEYKIWKGTFDLVAGYSQMHPKACPGRFTSSQFLTHYLIAGVM
jgi:hypothetical protein